MASLDAIDIKLLNLLQHNSRMTIKELSGEVHLSTTPVYERVKRLEADGYISKYVAMLDPEKLNLGFTVFVNVKLVRQSHLVSSEFIDKMKELDEVTECYSVSGPSDFLLKVYAPDMAHYRQFVLDVLGKLDSVQDVESIFVMSEVKHNTQLPLKDTIK